MQAKYKVGQRIRITDEGFTSGMAGLRGEITKVDESGAQVWDCVYYIIKLNEPYTYSSCGVQHTIKTCGRSEQEIEPEYIVT